MDFTKQLTREQSQQFQKFKSTVATDEKTQELCLSYYNSYKQQTGYVPNDRICLALKCAYLMAQKSQCIYNVKGEKVRGIGMSLNQLLKTQKLDDIMIMLKQFCKKVKITDEQAQNDLNAIVKQISFLITFHGKFDKVMQQLEIKEKVGQSFGYAKIFTSFIWLLYIQAKNKVLHRSLDLIQNTCMLAQTIAFMLIYSWEYVRPMALMKGDKKLTEQSSWKEVSYGVKEKVLDMFKIKDMDTYRHIAKSFEEFFQSMADGGVIKVTNGKRDFFSPQLINTNYKRLDHFYQKALNPSQLDERIFFKDRSTNLTPSKFTPFSRQGYANKLVKPIKMGTVNDKQNFTSHRILTYDLMDKQENLQKIIPVAEMKLPKTVMQTPSSLKIPLICSSPITTGMEMYNYLTEKVRKTLDKPVDSNVEPILARIFQKDGKDIENNTRNLKKGLICSFHRFIVESYLNANPSQSLEQVSKAFLALSVELVFFVSNISMSFQQIEVEIESQLLEEWKACQYLLKFDKSMPSTLKLRVLDIQVNIISQKIWKDEQIMQELLQIANNQQPSQQPVQRCFRRVLHQVAYQVSQLCCSLKLDDRASQGIFDTMKQVLINNVQLLQNRHIDQLIICCIYANCKLGQYDIKFNEIKQKYLELNPHNKQIHQEIMCKVYIDDQSPIDIIKFYNSYFIVKMKGFMGFLKEGGQLAVNKTRKNALLQSPLKTIIPKQFNLKQNKLAKPSNTPQTHLLYAYNESPLLKQQFQIRGPIQAKKVINFQEEEENLGKKKDHLDEPDMLHHHNTFTNDYINRKFRKKSSEKITNVATSNYSPHMINNQPQQMLVTPLRLTPTHRQTTGINSFRENIYNTTNNNTINTNNPNNINLNKPNHTKNPSTQIQSNGFYQQKHQPTNQQATYIMNQNLKFNNDNPNSKYILNQPNNLHYIKQTNINKGYTGTITYERR